MAGEKILIADNEKDIQDMLKSNLELFGCKAICTGKGQSVLERAKGERTDLIVLDRRLPDMDGLDILKKLKKDPDTHTIPVVLLTADAGASEMIEGFNIGAHDLVTKPFDTGVLLARIQAILRRRSGRPGNGGVVNSNGKIVLHSGKRQVLSDGKPVNLTYTEFRIISVLSSKPGWVFSRPQIVEQLDASQSNISDRSIDVQIVGLRRKLGQLGSSIETVRGVGYRLREKAIVIIKD